MVFGVIINIKCENIKKHITALCGRNSEFLNVTAGGIYRVQENVTLPYWHIVLFALQTEKEIKGT